MQALPCPSHLLTASQTDPIGSTDESVEPCRDTTLIANFMQKLATENPTPDAVSHSHEFELLRLCARTVLDPATREKIGQHLAAAIDWDFLIEAAHAHRVLPLIYRTFADTYADRVPKRA